MDIFTFYTGGQTLQIHVIGTGLHFNPTVIVITRQYVRYYHNYQKIMMKTIFKYS